MTPDPLIATARFDDASAAALQRLRDRFFPAKLNLVPAHLTLFHHLPGAEYAAVLGSLKEAGVGASSIPFATGRLRFLGRGVAVEILSARLGEVRAAIASRWAETLTAQDRQPFRPHVTIMNKAPPDEAREALRRLEAEGVDVRGAIEGLDLWHYRGGPWERAGAVLWG